MNCEHDDIFGMVPRWFKELPADTKYSVYAEVVRPAFRRYVRNHGDPLQLSLLSIEATYGLPFAMGLLGISDPEGVEEIDRITRDSLPQVRHKPLPSPGIHHEHAAGIEKAVIKLTEEADPWN